MTEEEAGIAVKALGLRRVDVEHIRALYAASPSIMPIIGVWFREGKKGRPSYACPFMMLLFEKLGRAAIAHVQKYIVNRNDIDAVAILGFDSIYADAFVLGAQAKKDAVAEITSGVKKHLSSLGVDAFVEATTIVGYADGTRIAESILHPTPAKEG